MKSELLYDYQLVVWVIVQMALKLVLLKDDSTAGVKAAQRGCD